MITVEELRMALIVSWGADTAKGEWREDVPSLNQCAVTALVVQDYFGGDILRTSLNDGDSHYWNLLPIGLQVDLTSDQFEYTHQKRGADEIRRSRDYVLNSERAIQARTKERYEILAARVKKVLDDTSNS